jgi:diadenosine tetraphosphatase ApaH/serine/threonine PP2A family protein phosphatase
MLIAVLADIHANREALDATLAHLARFAPEKFVLLGDQVGYGPDPAYAVEVARRLTGEGAVCLRGNHDEAVIDGPAGMTETARDAIRWTQRQLSAEQKAFLAGLPLTYRDGDFLFVHASAARPEAWPYVRDADAARTCLQPTEARTVVCGHTHVPAIYYVGDGPRAARFTPLANKPAPLFSGRRQVVVAGSVGQPRDGNPAACAVLLDTEAMTVTMLRVPYDAAETARKIEAAGLPRGLGQRLLRGR